MEHRISDESLFWYLGKTIKDLEILGHDIGNDLSKALMDLKDARAEIERLKDDVSVSLCVVAHAGKEIDRLNYKIELLQGPVEGA